jgi:ATP-binding cassette, subfamily C (CFTR/MRP), member 1
MQKISGGEQFDVVKAFTSLSLINILIDPVSELVMAVTNMASALSCLDRIQEFLVKDKREDYRIIRPARSLTGEVGLSGETPWSGPLARIENGSFGWTNDKTTIKDANLEVWPGTLTIVIGPVGSGKSTLLKAIVGETHKIAGAVELCSAEVAYCDQDPWILNLTIRDNIVGASDFSQRAYDRIIEACQLKEDLHQMANGDQTTVGSQGGSLSGGQKHRIVSYWPPKDDDHGL